MASVKASPSGKDKIQKAIEAKGWNTSNDTDASIEVSCYRLRQSLKHRGWELNRLLKDREIKKLGVFDEKNLDEIKGIAGRSSKNYEDILQNIENQKIAVKGCSPSTWKRFREAKKTISIKTFQVFCEFLELDWEDIKEFEQTERETTQESPEFRQNTVIGALPPNQVEIAKRLIPETLEQLRQLEHQSNMLWEEEEIEILCEKIKMWPEAVHNKEFVETIRQINDYKRRIDFYSNRLSS